MRGATHHLDIGQYLAYGMRLLLHGDRGFACSTTTSSSCWPRATRRRPTALLWAALAESPEGGTIGVDFLSAENQWAIRTVLDAGLALSPDGPIYTAGDVGPMAPYIPCGAYL